MPAGSFRWPTESEAARGAALARNRRYSDLRGLQWRDFLSIHRTEGALLERVARGAAEDDLVRELAETASGGGHPLLGLDIGVASPVAALSAFGAIPAYSCNGGVLGSRHKAEHPIIGFYAAPKMARSLLTCATDAAIGLRPWNDGIVLAYAADVVPLREFGLGLMKIALG